jgi:hypothetical protein
MTSRIDEKIFKANKASIPLGSLIGIWRTRDGHFVELIEENSRTFSGWLITAEGKRFRVIYYRSPNHTEDSGLDLMIRKRGEETMTEDFKWPTSTG